MSRHRNRRKLQGSMSGMNGDMYFQTASYNSRLFMAYFEQIMKLAVNRYHWVNLPATCNERYMERVLLFQGAATIAYPRKLFSNKKMFVSTMMAQAGGPNIYDNPIKWRSIGNNGWNFSCDYRNGVVVWDNRDRYPMLDLITVEARELVDIKRTAQINRMHVKTPYIIQCNPEQEQQAINIYKQIAGNEPCVITTDGLNHQIDIAAIQTGVTYLGEELTAAMINEWQQIYQMLGIENLTYKAERMVQDEVDKRDKPTEIIALDGLNCRRDACNEMNERFGDYLDGEMTCVWAQDNISANYNLLANVAQAAALEVGEPNKEGDNDGSNA